jgi:hypothetical protein
MNKEPKEEEEFEDGKEPKDAGDWAELKGERDKVNKDKTEDSPDSQFKPTKMPNYRVEQCLCNEGKIIKIEEKNELDGYPSEDEEFLGDEKPYSVITGKVGKDIKDEKVYDKSVIDKQDFDLKPFEDEDKVSICNFFFIQIVTFILINLFALCLIGRIGRYVERCLERRK